MEYLLMLQHHLGLTVRGGHAIGRRHFLRGVAASGLAAGALSWTDALAVSAADMRQRGMACILLWMPGGPSQFETFDPKPNHENAGETGAISTNVPGTIFADNLPHLARIADQLAVVRSMSTKIGEHQLASFLMHTAYVPSATVRHPTLGSVVAKEIGDVASQLPSFVRIGQGQNAGTGGLLGNEFDPLVMQSAQRPPENSKPTTESRRYQSRLALLDRLEGTTDDGSLASLAADHRKMYEQASQMVLSPEMEAFDLSREPEHVRKAYGISGAPRDSRPPNPGGMRGPNPGDFAAGCLMARRLVERGVTFVEVNLPNWDSHQDNFPAHRRLCEAMDLPTAALIEDLRQRGMLDRTLVVWMGEFGRTPRVNPRGGRDHYPRAFNMVLAGAGIQVGQVYGETSPGGDEVVDSPVSEKDLFQTIYKCLGIDAAKEYMSPIGRPIRIVDGGSPVAGLLS
ncbi:MAG TPA: DUF1501 domain-containing protein [Pirellulales bacterium]|jgi:hypothetical protein|nr:DUF1501 domain-containing protein [Pirellulales bacterium]